MFLDSSNESGCEEQESDHESECDESSLSPEDVDKSPPTASTSTGHHSDVHNVDPLCSPIPSSHYPRQVNNSTPVRTEVRRRSVSLVSSYYNDNPPESPLCRGGSQSTVTLQDVILSLNKISSTLSEVSKSLEMAEEKLESMEAKLASQGCQVHTENFNIATHLLSIKAMKLKNIFII